MNSELWSKAQKLAKRGYDITIEQDTLSDGKPVYVVRNSELPGCKAQGSTIDVAKTNLDDARADYIYALLEQGLQVPAPSNTAIVTGLPKGNSIGSKNAAFTAQSTGGSIDFATEPDDVEHGEGVHSIRLQGDLVEYG